MYTLSLIHRQTKSYRHRFYKYFVPVWNELSLCQHQCPDNLTMAVLLVLTVFVMLMGSVAAFRPVILMHGILSSAKHMEHLASFIKWAHPGTVVMNVDIFSNLESGAPMWQQLLTLEDTVRPLMKKHPEGVNMVCFSQGMHAVCIALHVY